MEITQLTDGTRILFQRPDGAIYADTIRGNPFLQCTVLQPYAPNEEHMAVVLTHHSWCHVSDIVGVV